MLGKPGTTNCQYMIACESFVLTESKSFKDSLIDLISAYYVFDIAYPKPLASCLIFFQHFVFDLKDSQLVPLSTSTLIANLK